MILKNNTKINIAIMTTWCVQACGLNSLAVYFDVKTCDICKGNVTLNTEIQIDHIHSLGFWIISKGVT